MIYRAKERAYIAIRSVALKSSTHHQTPILGEQIPHITDKYIFTAGISGALHFWIMDKKRTLVPKKRHFLHDYAFIA